MPRLRKLSPCSGRTGPPPRLPRPPRPPRTARSLDTLAQPIATLPAHPPTHHPTRNLTRSYDHLSHQHYSLPESSDESDKTLQAYSSEEGSPEKDCVAKTDWLTKSCEDGLDSPDGVDSRNPPPRRSQSCNGVLDADEIERQVSQLSLPTPLNTTCQAKRKKNFMDRCVNKVRSFISK